MEEKWVGEWGQRGVRGGTGGRGGRRKLWPGYKILQKRKEIKRNLIFVPGKKKTLYIKP